MVFGYSKQQKLRDFLKTIMANYRWKQERMIAHSLLVEVIIGTFLDAVATVHVLTASNNDVKLVEDVHFAFRLNPCTLPLDPPLFTIL